MKRVMKLAAGLFGAVVFLAMSAWAYVEATYEKDYSQVPMPQIAASTDPEVIARGEYVVHALAHCSACHQDRELTAARKLTDTLSRLPGGYTFAAGPFGNYHAANLTSDPETGLGSVSDGQIARAIRHGVDRTGRYAAFMAFSVGAMADEDLTAVVSYLRTLPPVKNPVPRDEWGIIAKAMSGTFKPKEETRLTWVAPGGVSVERGAYLSNGPAFCYGCHTPHDVMAGFAEAGPRFSGEPTPEPDHEDEAFEYVQPNLTSDPETGYTAKVDEEQWVARFRAGRAFPTSKMPWENFARMTDDDLRSLYRYFRSLPPVKRDVGPSRRRAGWKPGQPT